LDIGLIIAAMKKHTDKLEKELTWVLAFINFIFHTINALNFIDKYSGLNLQNKHATICLLPTSIFPLQLKEAL
jgi:hypothetical protein